MGINSAYRIANRRSVEFHCGDFCVNDEHKDKNTILTSMRKPHSLFLPHNLRMETSFKGRKPFRSFNICHLTAGLVAPRVAAGTAAGSVIYATCCFESGKLRSTYESLRLNSYNI